MATTSLHTLPALDLAKLIREGAISSEELVRCHLERIEDKNPTLSAFVTVFADAVKVARRKDRERLRHRDALPPFHGVPIGIKDLNVVRFSRTRFGSRGMPSIILPFDDANVGPLRRAGFVILGKLATSELGAMPVIEPDIHPPTRNSLEPRPHLRRLQWRIGGGGGGGNAADRAGLRRRRIDSHPVILLRPLRPQALAWPGREPVPLSRSADPLHVGADGPDGRRRRGPPRRHGGDRHRPAPLGPAAVTAICRSSRVAQAAPHQSRRVNRDGAD
jgi:hypothetical protein